MILSNQAELMSLWYMNFSPDLEGDVSCSVCVYMPGLNKPIVSEAVIRVKNVNGVIPVVEVLTWNGIISKLIWFCK